MKKVKIGSLMLIFDLSWFFMGIYRWSGPAWPPGWYLSILVGLLCGALSLIVLGVLEDS